MLNFVAKLAVTAAMEALQVGLQASQRTKGPRLDELQVTVADYGTPLPRFLGARKFACPLFWAEDLKETEHTSKVKGGGKQTTYHYTGTFAVALADCERTAPIDKLLRLWFDDKLVYDATGAGPISYASSLGIDLDTVMRVYLGTETQTPDPAYAAWCEDKYGPNSAPAFRGLSYLVFDALPLDNFGNRIPQVTALVSSQTAANYPYDTRTTAFNDSTDAFSFSEGGEWMVNSKSNGALEWWDIATRTKIGTSAGPGGGYFTTSSVGAAIDSTGNAYTAGWHADGTYVAMTAPLGTPVQTRVDSTLYLFQCTRVLETGAVPSMYSAYQTQAGYLAATVGGTALLPARVAHPQSARDFCLKSDGTQWGLFQPTGSSNQFTVEVLGGGGSSFTITGSATRTGPNAAYVQHVASQAQFLVITDGYWYAVDDATGAVKASGAWAGGTPQFRHNNPNVTSFWTFGTNFNEYSLTDASLIRSMPKSNWLVNSDGHYRFDPVNEAVWSIEGSGTNVIIRYLDRAANSGVMLGSIVSAMCDAAGLTDRDTSLLTDTVAGYSWTRGDVKSQMEPLLDIHDVDARPHDFTMQFLPRGSAPSGTQLTQDFAVQGNDSARYKVTITQDTDLPQSLRVNFADTGFDQQINNVISILPTDAVDSQRDDTIDLSTYADTPTGAQQKADRYLRREWNSRETVENSLTAQCFALEPGDVTALNLDGIVHNARLTKQTVVGTRIDCTFVRDETSFAAINSATTGPDMQGRYQETIQIPAPIKTFVIDAPYRDDSDADARPLLYAAVGAYASMSFPGAAIYEETGSGSSAAFDTLFDTITGGATWGTCNGTLANVLSPWLWDRGNTLNVTLQNGTLSPCAEADIDADPSLNLILIGSNATGWEYVNFCSAVLQSDGSYTLSDFKRGRRGTEWMCGLHTTGEAWILASSMKVEEEGLDEVGANLAFKGQAIGRSLDSAPEIDLAPYTGATLKPYAPARVDWAYDGTDLTGTITRRTRVGGAWTGGSAIPLSEGSEAYEVDVVVSGVVKRTISVTGTNVFTYTAAMAAADGVSLPARPSVNVYQMSDAVGRGYALAA